VPQPAYQRIADDIRRKIRTGEFEAGMQLSSPFLCSDYSRGPYPGTRPGVSFVEFDGAAWVVHPSADSRSGWLVTSGSVSSADLDVWLSARMAPPLAGRLPMLAYGSNASPGKIEWLREQGLTGPSIVVEADVENVTAVWSGGVRARDGQRPAVLTAAQGVTERHAVWFVTPEQRRVFDQIEGRGERYRLVWLHAPVRLADGERLNWVLAYIARPEVMGHEVPIHLNRSPLLVDGETVRVSAVPQALARQLTGELAKSDGLDVVEVKAEPAWSDLGTATDPGVR
jgi:hypothetical protein